MRPCALMMIAIAACSSSRAPDPPVHAPAPRTDASNAALPDVAIAAGCTLLPQPAKPGHTSVEPDDMACMHGDYVFDCPATFDAAKYHCQRSTAKAWAAAKPWCCPAP